MLTSIVLHVPCWRAMLRLAPLLLGGGACLWRSDVLVARADAPPVVPLPPQQPPQQAVLDKLLGGQNQFATGGLTLMAVGAAAAGARSVLLAAVRQLKRHVLVQAEIESRDDAYRWVMFWLSRHPSFARYQHVSVTTSLSSTFGTSVPQQAAAAGPAGSGPPVSFLPAPGDHLLRYGGRWLLVSRTRSSNQQLAANARLLMETLTISMLGTDRRALEALLAEAATTYNASQACRTLVHSVDQDGYWAQVGSRPVRPLSTVILEEGQAELLLSDCREFLASEAWYARRGIPYRRGYLLSGPPGTGKTSTCMALAGALGLEIYVVTLSSPSMTDETLRSLLNQATTRSILLLEDVDAAFVDRTSSTAAAGLTFSGLLNAIDGVAAQEGRLLFMTTNHIHRLSSALIRPGRVDVRCVLGPASRAQARLMFTSFFRDLPQPAAPMADHEATASGTADQGQAGAGAALDEAVLEELAEQFAAQLPEQPMLSTAQLQAFLMTHRKAPADAVAAAGAWVKQQLAQAQEQER